MGENCLQAHGIIAVSLRMADAQRNCRGEVRLPSTPSGSRPLGSEAGAATSYGNILW